MKAKYNKLIIIVTVFMVLSFTISIINWSFQETIPIVNSIIDTVNNSSVNIVETSLDKIDDTQQTLVPKLVGKTLNQAKELLKFNNLC